MLRACGCPRTSNASVNCTCCPGLSMPPGTCALETKTSRPPIGRCNSGHRRNPKPREELKDFTVPMYGKSKSAGGFELCWLDFGAGFASRTTCLAWGFPSFHTREKLTMPPMTMPPSTAWFKKTSQPWLFKISWQTMKPKPFEVLKVLMCPVQRFSALGSLDKSTGSDAVLAPPSVEAAAGAAPSAASSAEAACALEPVGPPIFALERPPPVSDSPTRAAVALASAIAPSRASTETFPVAITVCSWAMANFISAWQAAERLLWFKSIPKSMGMTGGSMPNMAAGSPKGHGGIGIGGGKKGNWPMENGGVGGVVMGGTCPVGTGVWGCTAFESHSMAPPEEPRP
mmetsp:Transcript_78702/g.227529  ORF Transcript_78702/g.227529 Transcript_78702/m.227529 type:complete len:343 (-) Transcript_78702:87-1115(-)